MSCTPCGPLPAPCPENDGLICHPSYYSMIEVPRLRILGVPNGAQCQQFLQRKRGFVFDDGSGLGQFIEDQPALTLPIINPITGSAYQEPPGFPFLIIGTGSNPHVWRFVQGKTGVAAALQWDGTLWRVVEAGAAPAQTLVCSSGGVNSSVGLFGCYKTGLDGDGNPTYALRKLTARDKRAVVGAIDGDGVHSFHSILDNEHLEHPLGKFTLTRWNTVQAMTDGGVDEASGLPEMVAYGAGAVSGALMVFYSPTTKKFYLAPDGYHNAMSIGATAMPTNAFQNIFTWTNIVINYPRLLITFFCCTGLDISTVEILVDGVIKQSFVNGDPGDADGEGRFISGSITLGGIVPGVHTVVIRQKNKLGTNTRSGNASLCVIPGV